MLPNALYLRHMTNILITTTPTVQNRPVREYLGIVSGEAFIDSIDSEDSSMLRKARDMAIQEMIEEAEELGADAVIGVKIDYKITLTGKFSGYFEGDFLGNYRGDLVGLKGSFGMNVKKKYVGDRDWDGSGVVGRAGGGQP